MYSSALWKWSSSRITQQAKRSSMPLPAPAAVESLRVKTGEPVHSGGQPVERRLDQ